MVVEHRMTLDMSSAALVKTALTGESHEKHGAIVLLFVSELSVQ